MMKELKTKIKELEEELKKLKSENDEKQLEYEKTIESQLKGKTLRIDSVGEYEEGESSTVWIKKVENVFISDWKIYVQGDGVWYSPSKSSFEVFKNYTIEVPYSDQESFKISDLIMFSTIEDMKKDIHEEFEYFL